ncbi:hypothetical protein ScPMuIL_000273 [Solemya velum]
MSKASKFALARSRSIDHQLDEDRERRQKEVQLLILGGAGSGKSTFIKQIQLNYGDGFPESERLKFRTQVYENVVESIHVLLDCMKSFNLTFKQEGIQKKVQEFQLKYPRLNLKALFDEIPDDDNFSNDTERVMKMESRLIRDYYIDKLDSGLILPIWNDEAIQTCFTRRKEYAGISMAYEHYLSSMKRICDQYYVPTIKDILFIRRPTLGVKEYSFTVNSFLFRFVDVAGQKSQRKKWIHLFEGVTAIFFFVSLSGYDETLDEDETLNSLQDSLQTFHQVTHNPYLERTDCILFLNKYDLFEQKIKKTNLNTCFPEYSGSPNTEMGVEFIRECFRKNSLGHRHLYTHIMCAIDVEKMRNVLRTVIDTVMDLNMRRGSMLA